jgi:catechol 2,3-dioxygenase-like lactoylglutathione lyase family enzyme
MTSPPPGPVGRLVDTVLDCSDAEALAEFWCAVLGFEVSHREEGWVSAERDGRRLSFQQVTDFEAPDWPGQAAPQQMHLDVLVTDLDAASRRTIELGARPLTDVLDPGPQEWRIFADPDGHPFCLVTGR